MLRELMPASFRSNLEKDADGNETLICGNAQHLQDFALARLLSVKGIPSRSY